jgi:hypothetical protein
MGLGSQFLLEACARAGVAVRTLELTTPGRSESRQGQLNPHSLLHAVKLFARFSWLLLTRRVSRVYVPIAQWGLPLARDVTLVLTASLFAVPVTLHLHGSQLAERISHPQSAGDHLLRRVLRRHRWAVLSNQLRDLLLSSGAASVHVVRNPAHGAPAVGESKEPQLRIGFLGLCCTEKGLDILLSGIDRVRTEHEVDATLTIAGPIGNLSPPKADWIRYLGKVPHEQLDTTFWPTVDLLALPARWHEGLPFVVLEALQRGKVVAASASRGLGELLEGGAVAAVDPDVDACVVLLDEVARDLIGLRRTQQAAWAALFPRFEPDRLMRDWLSGLGLSH